MDYEQLKGMKPEALDQAADVVQQFASRVRDHAIDFSTRVRTPLGDSGAGGIWDGDWVGPADVAAGDAQLATNRAADEMEQIHPALTHHAEGLRRYQRALEDIEHRAAKQGAQIHPDGSVTVSKKAGHHHAEHGGHDVAQDIRDDIQRVIDKAVKLEGETAGKLSRLLTGSELDAAKVGVEWRKRARLVKEVNSGNFDNVDGEEALAIPYKDYSPAGQKHLAKWAHDHPDNVGEAARWGGKINLPPSDTAYEFDVPAIETNSKKLEYHMKIPPHTGASNVTVTQTAGGSASVSGALGSSEGSDSVSLSDKGITAAAMANVGKGQVGISWEKDGPWYRADFTPQNTHLPNGQTAVVTPSLSVRPDLDADQWDPSQRYGHEHETSTIKSFNDGLNEDLSGLPEGAHVVIAGVVYIIVAGGALVAA